jgi:hypothetical protein
MSDSINPANEGSLAGAFNHIVNKMLQQKNDMLPAQIISFDRATNRATVKPLIRILTTDGTTISRANNINLTSTTIKWRGIYSKLSFKRWRFRMDKS